MKIMMKIRFFLLLFIYLPLASCASVSLESNNGFSKDSVENIPLYVTQEKLEKTLGKPTMTAEHPNGVAVYYDIQMGHHEAALAKFAFNKKNQLIGKTWYCRNNCEEAFDKSIKRQPAGTFVESAPVKGTKLVYGPTERFYTDASRNIMIEADDGSISVIHWDAPGSNYLNR